MTVHHAERAFPFVVGAGRSGTTLLKAMLDSHPELTIPGESGFVVRFGKARRQRRYMRRGSFDVEVFLEDLLKHRGFSRWKLPEPDIRAALYATPVTGYPDVVRRIYRLWADHAGKARYGDKTPEYVLYMPMLAAYFPEARFIHIVRDGRDVALSHLDIKEWGPTTVEEAALEWKQWVAAGRRDGRALGDRYREVRYEDLVREPEGIVRGLCTFIGLSFDDAMLRYFERVDNLMRPEVFPTQHKNIAAPPTAGLRDWRRDMSREQVETFEALAGGLLDDLGYERESRSVSLTARSRAGARVAALKARRMRGYARSARRKLTNGELRSALLRS